MKNFTDEMGDFMSKNILVLGAGGFVGKNLCVSLVEQGHSVIAVLRHNKAIKEFKDAQKNELRLAIGDVRDQLFCDCLMKDTDVVINLAATIIGEERKQFNDNIEGFFSTIETAQKNEVEKYIYASSAAVYGKGNVINHEKDLPRPLGFYSVTKYIDELIADYYSSHYKIDVTGLRFFNIYGSDDINGRDVVSRYFKAAVSGSDIEVDNPNASRDFIFVDDVICFLSMIVRQDVNVEEKVLNIGSGQSVPIIDIANNIKEITLSNSKIVVKNKEIATVKSVADISMMEKYYKPKYLDIRANLEAIYKRNQQAWRNL